MIEVGQKVKVVKGESAGSKELNDSVFNVIAKDFQTVPGKNHGRYYVTLDNEKKTQVWINEVMDVKGVNMFKQIGSDLKEFVGEHRQTIYWIAVLFLADYFFFNGAFRERLQGIMNKMLGKVEASVEGKPLAVVAAEKKV